MRASLGIPVGQGAFQAVRHLLKARTDRDQTGLVVPALTNDEVVNVIGMAQDLSYPDQRVDEIGSDLRLIHQRRVDLKIQAPQLISSHRAGLTLLRIPAGRPGDLPADAGIPAAPEGPPHADEGGPGRKQYEEHGANGGLKASPP